MTVKGNRTLAADPAHQIMKVKEETKGTGNTTLTQLLTHLKDVHDRHPA
jgi:hypothetical protein